MTVREAIKASLRLLSGRDRWRLALITVAQMSTSFLDLLGVLLIGLVTALSLSVMSSTPQPMMVESSLEFLGLSNDDPVKVALALAAAAGFLLVLKSVLNMLLTKRILRFLANKQALVSGRLAAGLLSRPLLQVQQQSSQQAVYTLTNGVAFATVTILGQGTIALTEATLLVVLALGVLAISPVVTVFTIVFFVFISVALQRAIAAKSGRRGQRSAQLSVKSVQAVQEALRTYRESVVLQRRGLYVQRFQDLCRQGAVNTTEIQFAALIPKYVLEIALVCGAGLLAVSQLLTRDVSAAVAIIAVFLAAGSRIVPSILRLQGASILIRTAAGQAAPTYELARELDLEHLNSATAESFGSIDPETIRAHLQKGHEGFDGSISISDADLFYPGASVPALTAVSLNLPAGASLAIVGPTGAGKSTLADLILGVLTPDSGVTLIGGLTPAEAIANWPGAVAYVPQDVAMANGTVRENVALGLPLEIIDDGWVWDALNRAHLGEFLRESRQGLDTVIGENGLKLSGGQRQRLGIARALYSRPKLLVLDEATSALDAETEQAIAQTLKELGGTVTTVSIAHRLATIRHCDLVVYLEDGRVQAQGNFSEVRAMAPQFDRQAQLLGL
ncbi:MAG: ABC transporter ATP-binding protein [Candidatus Nanopelagicales bacterium]|nr:ABC transporter ATP-binding protein [Candidatus Nanopelagicales bacterium]